MHAGMGKCNVAYKEALKCILYMTESVNTAQHCTGSTQRQ